MLVELSELPELHERESADDDDEEDERVDPSLDRATVSRLDKKINIRFGDVKK